MLLAAVLAVVGCTTRVPPPLPPPPIELPPAPLDPAAMCLRTLTEASIAFQEVPSFRTAEGCGVDNGVRLQQAAIAWNQPATVTCELAALLRRFESEAVQPLAQQHLRQPVKRIHHAGSYACRNENRGRRRLSQHAFGRAIDILGFELADGTVISVKRHWPGPGAGSAFLRAVAGAACAHFNLVLGPSSDAYHLDHLHLDIGPYRNCRR